MRTHITQQKNPIDSRATAEACDPKIVSTTNKENGMRTPLRSLHPNGPLDARGILLRGLWDFATTAVLFLVLAETSPTLRAAVNSSNDSAIRHAVLQVLESAIFFGGSIFIFLVVVYLLIIAAWDLWKSLRETIKTSRLTNAEKR